MSKPLFVQPERAVLRACLDWLHVRGILAWRSNNAGVRVGEGASRYAFHGMRGVPDILAVRAGKFYGIECKATNGKQSDHQKAFQSALEREGGIYLLVKSLSDLIEGMGDGK